MAKNWKIGEAVRAIRTGDNSAIMDLGKRFPLLVAKANTEEGLLEILDAIPEHISARQVFRNLAEGVVEVGNGDEVEEVVDIKDIMAKADKPEPESEPEPKVATVDYDSMTGAQLVQMCRARGLKVVRGMKKQDFIGMLTANDNGLDANAEDVNVKTKEEKKKVAKPAKTNKAKNEAVLTDDEPVVEATEPDDNDDDDDWDI